MKNWKVENDSGRKKISRGENPGRCTFLITIRNLNNLNLILKKCIMGYKFTKLQEKINHFMYMDSSSLWKMKKNWRLWYSQ